MASTLHERNHPSGRVTYRIVLRKKGIKSFSLTFEDRELASDWLDEHEHKFFENPDYYFSWREDLYKRNRREGVKDKRRVFTKSLMSTHSP